MYQDHIKAILAAWNEGNLSDLDDWVDENAVRIAPPSLSSDASNLAELKQVIIDFRTAFPDSHVAVDEIFYQGDRSFARWTFTGTNTGPGEFPATGKPVKIVGSSFARYEGGKLKEERVYFDAMDMMGQLGLLPE